MKKTIPVKSVTDFLEKIYECFREYDFPVPIYRGNGNIKWHLIPSIGQMSSQVKDYEDWQMLEDDLLEKYRKYSIPYLSSIPNNKFEWMILAQHHGLPTRLLDWTTNPLKALFFAVQAPSEIAADGSVWMLEPKGWFNDLTKVVRSHRGHFNEMAVYYPDHLDSRIVAQESCFLFFPLPKNTKPIPPLDSSKHYKGEVLHLFKFRIPSEEKIYCLQELKQLGITYSSLFPDLDGLSTSIRREFGLLW